MRAKYFSTVIAFLLATIFCNAQVNDPQLVKFWKNSDYRIANKLVSDFTRAAYYRFASEFYPKKSRYDLIDVVENIRTDYKLQDYMYLSFLDRFGKNDYFFKTELADICGTHTLGNYVAIFIKRKYSNDKRYLNWISERNANAQSDSAKYEANPEKKIEEIRDQQDDSLKIFKRVEVEATFSGGDGAFRNYLINELSKISNPSDIKLVVEFVVLKNGAIDSVKIETPTNTEIDQKIILIFKNMPNWIPAEQDAMKVNSFRRQPITLGNPDGQ